MSRIQFTGIALSLMLAVFDVGAQPANPRPPDFSKVDIIRAVYRSLKSGAS
jgi:hypothetical protein